MKEDAVMKNFFLFLILSAGLSCFAQQSAPLHIYFVPRVADTVTPENMLLDRVWKETAESAPFVLNVPKENKLYLKTVFRAAYNDRYLFVRVEAEEPLVNQMDFSKKPANRDSGMIFRNSNVEFFLDPGLQEKFVGQVVADVNGGIYDAIVCGGTSDWSYEVAVKTEKQRNCWRMAVAFPFKDKGVAVANVFGMFPHSTPLIGFNVCRSKTQGGHKATQWSKTPDNSYDRPNKFGILVMSGEKDAIHALENLLARKEYNGIILEGAVRNAGSIYKLAISKALAFGLSNGRMLPEPRRSQILKEFKAVQQALREKKSDSELSKMLLHCGTLNSEIAEKLQTMSNNILDEI